MKTNSYSLGQTGRYRQNILNMYALTGRGFMTGLWKYVLSTIKPGKLFGPPSHFLIKLSFKKETFVSKIFIFMGPLFYLWPQNIMNNVKPD